MKSKNIIIFVIALGLFLSVGFTVFLFGREMSSIPLHVLQKIESFQLTDSHGKNFTRSELDNKVWVADFIFTTCGSICPVMTKNMASLHRSYLLEDDVAFVSISVNPEYDSPEILEEYAKKFSADTRKWHFLTGPRENIKELAVRSFKVGDIKEPVFHSAKFILVDKSGHVRGYYEGTDKKEVKRLFVDIARVLKEGS